MTTITDILNSPANVEEIIHKATEINNRLKEVNNMPELEPLPHVPSWFYDDEPEHSICANCDGTGCPTCNYTGEV